MDTLKLIYLCMYTSRCIVLYRCTSRCPSRLDPTRGKSDIMMAVTKRSESSWPEKGSTKKD